MVSEWWLPEWEHVGGFGGFYEAEDRHGTVWRLWLVEHPGHGDPFPPGYRLAPRNDLSSRTYITKEHGLYHAIDTATAQVGAA
jgi:hypothetical protein